MSDDEYPQHTRTRRLTYVSTVPREVPAGQVLAHNNVTGGIRPRSRPGVRGFRAWFQARDAQLAACDCGWCPEIPAHYRVLRPRKYKGILAKPIAASDTDSDEDLWRETQTRLQALGDWYGVEPGNWQELALCLALAHVPGFRFTRPKSKGGRPPAFSPDTEALVLRAVATMQAVSSEHGRHTGEAEAARLVIRYWRDMGALEALSRRDLEAEARKLAKHVSKARAKKKSVAKP